MKVIFIFGLASLVFANKNDASEPSPREHKKRLKSEMDSEKELTDIKFW